MLIATAPHPLVFNLAIGLWPEWDRNPIGLRPFILLSIAQKGDFSAMDFNLITGSVISALILLVGHYFPWHKLLGEPLNRLWSYRYGSSACWVGFAYWRYFGTGDFVTPLGLMFVYVVGGSVVWLAYWLDAAGQTQTIRRRRAAGIKGEWD